MSNEIKFQPIKSTNLSEAGYDGVSKVQVRFKGGKDVTYEYEGITPDEWKAFEATFDADASSGQHFRANIQRKKFRKL